MLAFYLHTPRPAAVDRARAVLAPLGPDVVVVSPGARPLGWSTPWVELGGTDLTQWDAWLTEHDPRAVVVDGSVEHVLLARGPGRKVAVVASPGAWTGTADHRALEAADVILAPWARTATTFPSSWRDRTVHLGATGWAATVATEGRRRTTRSTTWSCVVLSPGHGGPGPRERRDLLLDVPGWQWWFASEREVLEPGPVWDRLLGAEVAVCAPTPANLAAVVATGTPTLLVVGERATPDELFLADVAERTGPVVVTSPPRSGDQWRALLVEVRGRRTRPWAGWAPGPGLRHFATALGPHLPPAAPTGSVDLATA